MAKEKRHQTFDAGIEVTVIPEHQIVTTLHYGDYETIGLAWHAVENYIMISGYEVCGVPYEIYLRGSESGVANGDFITQVVFRTSKKLR